MTEGSQTHGRSLLRPQSLRFFVALLLRMTNTPFAEARGVFVQRKREVWRCFSYHDYINACKARVICLSLLFSGGQEIPRGTPFAAESVVLTFREKVRG